MKPTHKTKQRSLWGHPVDNHKINGCQKLGKRMIEISMIEKEVSKIRFFLKLINLRNNLICL